MDQSGVLASLCFPTLPRFCGQLFMEASDREFGFQCLQIYNDWLVEEWCGAAPGRYIPLMLIPMWDPQLAVKEMERMAAKGVTSFAFSENPEPLGLPTIHDADHYWEPVMAAANELGMVASMHVGSSSTLPRICNDAPFMANLTWGASRTSGTMLSWLFSGLFQRYPNLKIALSEGEIGWAPYFLERAEQVLDKQRYWVKRGTKFMGHARQRGRPRHARHPGIVPQPHLRLHHRRPPRAQEPRRDRRGQHHVRDRLPAFGLDLAELHRRRPRHDEGPAGERPVQVAPRQRRAAVPVHAGRAARRWRRPERVAGVLDGKSAIVTGAGSGVGRVSALRFAQEGARVVAADINVDNAKETVREIESAGGTAIAVGVDVSDEQQVQAMIAAAVDQYGRLDILFNNVGIPTPRLGLIFEEHTLEDFNRLVAVNLGGVFLGCKHAVLQFKEQGDGGVILNTASVAGLVGWGGTVYGATKGGVIQLTRAVAVEAAPFGIRVNAICPAAMPLTGFMAAGGLDVDEAQQAAIAETVGAQHPLGRAITAEDCAEAAVYLVSDASRNVTGVALPIDGGFVAK